MHPRSEVGSIRLSAPRIRDSAGAQLPGAAENASVVVFEISLRHSRRPVADAREIVSGGGTEREGGKEWMRGEGLFHALL